MPPRRCCRVSRSPAGSVFERRSESVMRGSWALTAGVAAMTMSGVASAATETLREALIQTYNANPTIMAERARLRSTDESVAIARAAGRPQIDTSAGLNQDLVTRNLGRNQRDLSVSGTVSLPLYAGGRVRNSVRAANRRVEAGRADLRATEGDVFTEAVAAYMDVIRDRMIVNLNQNQVRVLETNLQATRDRFEVGDLTRTDVAQSEARLALARSALATAEGALETSEENFRRVIGDVPGDLQPPPPLPPLPGTADQAVQIALANNADLASIAAQARAAGYDVAAVRGERLPTISAVSSARHVNSLGRADEAAGTPRAGAGRCGRSPGAGARRRRDTAGGRAHPARASRGGRATRGPATPTRPPRQGGPARRWAPPLAGGSAQTKARGSYTCGCY